MLKLFQGLSKLLANYTSIYVIGVADFVCIQRLLLVVHSCIVDPFLLFHTPMLVALASVGF